MYCKTYRVLYFGLVVQKVYPIFSLLFALSVLVLIPSLVLSAEDSRLNLYNGTVNSVEDLKAYYALELQAIIDALTVSEAASRAEAEAIIPLESRISTFGDGGVKELAGLLYGFPVYFQTMNAVASDTISTKPLQPDGDSGLDLTGKGITIGLWDAENVRPTHVEFGGRITIDLKDTGIANGAHMTRVAGTALAS